MDPHCEVMFLRLGVASATKISAALQPWYAEGWRVVSHDESQGEYSFVLERQQETGR